jgi:hypothetical protein
VSFLSYLILCLFYLISSLLHFTRSLLLPLSFSSCHFLLLSRTFSRFFLFSFFFQFVLISVPISLYASLPCSQYFYIRNFDHGCGIFIKLHNVVLLEVASHLN